MTVNDAAKTSRLARPLDDCKVDHLQGATDSQIDRLLGMDFAQLVLILLLTVVVAVLISRALSPSRFVLLSCTASRGRTYAI